MKKINFILCIVISICFLTGCAYSNLSVMDIQNRTTDKITRSSSYWSGIQKGDRFEVEEGDEINFDIEIEKGSVTFILKDNEGNEVYTVTKEAEYNGTETYTAEKQGTLWLTEKGNSFKGKYEITREKSAENEMEETSKNI